VGLVCIVETGETSSTCKLSNHMESRNGFRPGTNRANEVGEMGGRRKRVLVAHFSVPVDPPETRQRDHNDCVCRAWHTLTASTPSTAKTDARKNCATAKREP